MKEKCPELPWQMLEEGIKRFKEGAAREPVNYVYPEDTLSKQ